ncbi:DUF6491 family protein [Asticcacaulis sp. AC402]|uniref:DUF6491 family protein n=1 Tax=Asticcacaulis sp. AC402 TaxID=1282361 RepID=UPI0003C3C58E|nr:DUF6491 family protein [Asticcacaulis sp. AC402]ESQ76333.1 hypothetical protein ABAC402_04340 [Asticcacaulis sp. AC402]
MTMKIRKPLGFTIAGLGAGMLAVTLVSTSQAGPSDDRRSADREVRGERVTPRCLDGDNVGRTHVVDQNTLLVYDRFDNAYKLDVGGPCRSMNDMSVIGFEFNGSTQICRAHDAMLLRHEPPSSMVTRCLINGIQPLTREEAAELDN